MTTEDRNATSDGLTFQTIFRLIVPVLLGALLTYAANISSSQTELAKSVYGMQGQLAGISQQNTDYLTRLSKVERTLENTTKDISGLDSRMAVVETKRRP